MLTFRSGLAAVSLQDCGVLASQEYDDVMGIVWEWQSLDGSMTKSPLGGEKNREKPDDRGKLGVKRSVLTDARGGPIGVAVDGADAMIKLGARDAEEHSSTPAKAEAEAETTSVRGQRI